MRSGSWENIVDVTFVDNSSLFITGFKVYKSNKQLFHCLVVDQKLPTPLASNCKTIHKPFFKSESDGGINVYVTYIFSPFSLTSAVFSRQLHRTEGLAGRYTVPKYWTMLAERLSLVPVEKQVLTDHIVNYSIIH